MYGTKLIGKVGRAGSGSRITRCSTRAESKFADIKILGEVREINLHVTEFYLPKAMQVYDMKNSSRQEWRTKHIQTSDVTLKCNNVIVI